MRKNNYILVAKLCPKSRSVMTVLFCLYFHYHKVYIVVFFPDYRVMYKQESG